MNTKVTPKHQTTTDEAIRQFETQAINFGYRFIKDSRVRRAYMEKTRMYAQSLRESLAAKEISPREAAQMAQEMRNEIMEWARAKTSDYGLARAKTMKASGRSFESLLDQYSNSKFKKPFAELDVSQRDAIFLEIVNSSGRARPAVSARVARLGHAGRALWILSLGVAAYNIASAEDKARATGREAASVGGGFAGGAAGGALAGVWAGPLGVAVGIAIGGMIGAIISDQVYIEASVADDRFVQRLIDKHTNIASTNEEAIATAIIKECSYEMDKVMAVFKELDWAYSTDADDIAVRYVQKLQSAPMQVKLAFKRHKRLRNLLISIMESGWTGNDEIKAIAYVRNL